MKDLNYFRQKWQRAVKANRIMLILLIGAILIAVGLGIACNIAKSAIYIGDPITAEATEEPTTTATAAPTEEPTEKPTVEPTTEPEATEEPTLPATPKATLNDYRGMVNMLDAQYLAKAIVGEAGVVQSTTRRAAVAWAILNRVDHKVRGTTVPEVVTAPRQIQGYWDYVDKEVDEYYINLAIDVLARWAAEKAGECPEFVGRILPSNYIYWYGDGRENHFTAVYHDASLEKAMANAWDWSLPTPYEN